MLTMTPFAGSHKLPFQSCLNSSSAGAAVHLDRPLFHAEIQAVPRVKKNVAIWLGYVGTHYQGLQIQRSTEGVYSVEDELEAAIYKAGGIIEQNYKRLDKVGWKRSSRTDKGVHSLSTVISMKLEVPVRACFFDADGLDLANEINSYLPQSIRIFGVVPVTKSFNARRACCSRSYDYYLPTTVLGLEKTSPVCDMNRTLDFFRAQLQYFEGAHPFHNYTIRRLYARPQKDNSSAADETFSYNVDRNADHRRVYWESGTNSLGSVVAGHYRKILQCTCGEPEEFGNTLAVRVKVTGQSFIIHQIRKMVATAIAATRSILPDDIIALSLCKQARVVLPIAPSQGLILSGNVFEGGNHGISMTENISHRKDSFWLQRLAPAVSEALNDEYRWKSWVDSLEKNRLPDAELDPVRDSWKWQQRPESSQD